MVVEKEQPWLWVMTGITSLVLVMLSGGCATTGHPTPLDHDVWMKQAFSQIHDDVTVWIALPDDRQTRAHFGAPLQTAKIQPLWVRVDNRSMRPYWLLPAYTDPAYFSSAEVARHFRHAFESGKNRKRQLIRIEEVCFDQYIPPDSHQNGFLYTELHDGSQLYSIALLSTGSLLRFDFLIPTDRLHPDYKRLSASTNIVPGNGADLADHDHLRRNLESLPAHTSDAAGKRAGDPINFFVVAPWEVFFPALISSGWDETEILNTATALRTTKAFMLQTPYRHSPVSPLYFLGHRQDASFQKTRGNINTRNHLRLWRLPFTFKGQSAWAGQISRDIGVRATLRTPWLTTHEIDPDVDGARWALVQDLIKAQAVAQVGFAEGGIRATPLAPLHNLTGDPYFTDGLRSVLFLTPSPVAADEIAILPWANPPSGGLSRPGDYLKTTDDPPSP